MVAPLEQRIVVLEAQSADAHEKAARHGAGSRRHEKHARENATRHARHVEAIRIAAGNRATIASKPLEKVLYLFGAKCVRACQELKASGLIEQAQSDGVRVCMSM